MTAIGCLPLRAPRAALPDAPALPPLAPGEVEVARLEVGLGAPRLLSLRERVTPAGHCRYRLVDESAGRWRLARPGRAGPLGPDGLASLLDGATCPGWPGDGDDLVAALRAEVRVPALVPGWVRVRAPAVPGLEAIYAERERVWLAERGAAGEAERRTA